jgi:ElaB/YqjD/DUF883 family membrane-anchored ribosome-binding protein
MAQLDTPSYRSQGRDESVVSQARASGREALTSFSDVATTMGDALDESLERRPYATLAIAAGIGFLLGAVWAR